MSENYGSQAQLETSQEYTIANVFTCKRNVTVGRLAILPWILEVDDSILDKEACNPDRTSQIGRDENLVICLFLCLVSFLSLMVKVTVIVPRTEIREHIYFILKKVYTYKSRCCLQLLEMSCHYSTISWERSGNFCQRCTILNMSLLYKSERFVAIDAWFAGLPRLFRSASPSNGVSSARKGPSSERRQDGRALPSQTLEFSEGVRQRAEGWCVFSSGASDKVDVAISGSALT
jgi:hypothetical protein